MFFPFFPGVVFFVLFFVVSGIFSPFSAPFFHAFILPFLSPEKNIFPALLFLRRMPESAILPWEAIDLEKKHVLLSVAGQSQADTNDQPETVRLLTTGTFTGNRDCWRIDYTETQPDDSHSHDVILTMEKGVVTMQRVGDFATSMVFEQGRRFEGSYHTPFGALDMGVYATQVKYEMDEQAQSGEVNLKYQLDLQGQYAAMHELHIRFCPSGGRA